MHTAYINEYKVIQCSDKNTYRRISGVNTIFSSNGVSVNVDFFTNNTFIKAVSERFCKLQLLRFLNVLPISLIIWGAKKLSSKCIINRL